MRNPGPGTGPRRAPRARGFTLTELVAATAIGVVLLGIALPGYSRIVDGSRATAMMLELRGLLEGARKQATTRFIEVTLCGTRDGRTCSNTWDGNPTLVFVDRNLNRRLDAGEELIATSELTRSGQIRWRASGNRNYLRYRANGSVREYGSFDYCPRDRDPHGARQIIISATGRARAATDGNGDGIVEDRNGRPLQC